MTNPQTNNEFIELTRLQEAILRVAMDEFLNGNDIIRAIHKGSGGKISLSIGTFYVYAKALTKLKLLEARWEADPPEELAGNRRKEFKLSALGQRVLSGNQELRDNLVHWRQQPDPIERLALGGTA